MYSVSEKYSKAIVSDVRDMPYRVTLSGSLVLDQTRIPSMTLTESASGNDGISIGTANSASLKLTLRDAEVVDYSDVLVEPESGIVLPDGSIEWIPLGKFWVTDHSTSNDYKTVTLNCSDGMYLMSGEYISELTYPTTIKAVVNEIVAKTGVTFVGFDSLPNIIVRVNPGKMTYRNAIGYAAGCCGRNARFNRNGELEFFWYNDTGITIGRETQYLNGMTRLNDKPLQVAFEVTGKQETYAITCISDGGGGITATPGQNVVEGETVVLSINPFKDFELATISAVTDGGVNVTLYKNSEGGYTFTQPDSNVTVTVSFKSILGGPFNLTVRAYDGGGIMASGDLFDEGDSVGIFVTADDGYSLDKFITTPADLSLTYLGVTSDGEDFYEFTMPASDVTINAYFKEEDSYYTIERIVDYGGFSFTPGYIVIENLTSGGSTYKAGDVISVLFARAQGHVFDYYESNVDMIQMDTDEFRFTMPERNVSITAHFKWEDDESKTGQYSWLASPKNNQPPTTKPYWAVFYKRDISVPTCQRFNLVWFDNWSVSGYESDGYGKRLYSINLNGYYYCGSRNTGYNLHEWDTSMWSGNGASGSTLEWDSVIGSTWAGNPMYSGDYCLLASNIHLYYNSTLIFQMCEKAIGTPQIDLFEGGFGDSEDVRERGAFGYYKCPDTFSTPAPASNWMILNSHDCLLMEREEDEAGDGNPTYSGYGSGWSGLYVVWFDNIQIESIGSVFTNSNEEFYIAHVTNGRYVSLCRESGTWGTLREVGENQVIGLRNPLISEEYASDIWGTCYFNGVLASSCYLEDTYGDFVRFKNDCTICDCVASVSEPVIMYSRRRSVMDSIEINAEGLTVTTDGDTVVLQSKVLFVSTDGDTISLTIGSYPTVFESVKLSYTNPMIYEKSVADISNLVQGVTYTPAKVKHRGNPAFQVGDIVTVPDKNLCYHSILIMQQTMTFGGGMNSEIACSGRSEKQTSFSSNGPITTQIKQEVAQSSAESERRMSANNALVFASIYRTIGNTESKISEVVEWQTEKSATIASLEQVASEHEATIEAHAEILTDTSHALAELKLEVDNNGASIGLLVEDGEVKGSIVIEAINDETAAKISADRLDIEGKLLNIKVDHTNIEGKITADQLEVNDLSAVGATIGGWNIGEDSIYKETEMGDKTYRVLMGANLYTSGNPIPYNPVFGVIDNTDGTWSNWKFYVRSNGDVYCQTMDLGRTFTSIHGWNTFINGNNLHDILEQICTSISNLDARVEEVAAMVGA